MWQFFEAEDFWYFFLERCNKRKGQFLFFGHKEMVVLVITLVTSHREELRAREFKEWWTGVIAL